MITIKLGDKTREVPRGAYEHTYKALGYEIVADSRVLVFEVPDIDPNPEEVESEPDPNPGEVESEGGDGPSKMGQRKRGRPPASKG